MSSQVADAYLLDTLSDSNRASAYSGYSATVMLIQAGGSVSVGTLPTGE
jgi:DHA1 family inner membrane transport protein